MGRSISMGASEWWSAYFKQHRDQASVDRVLLLTKV